MQKAIAITVAAVIVAILAAGGLIYFGVIGEHSTTRALLRSYLGQPAARTAAINSGQSEALAAGQLAGNDLLKARALEYISLVQRGDYQGAYKQTSAFSQSMAFRTQEIRARYPENMWSKMEDDAVATLVSPIKAETFADMKIVRANVSAAVAEIRQNQVFLEIQYADAARETSPYIPTQLQGKHSFVARKLKTATLRFDFDANNFISGVSAIPESYMYFDANKPEFVALTWNISGGLRSDLLQPHDNPIGMRVVGGQRPYSITEFLCVSRTTRVSVDLTANSVLTGEDADNEKNYIDDGVFGGMLLYWSGFIDPADMPFDCSVHVSDAIHQIGTAKFQLTAMPAVHGWWGYSNLCWIAEGLSPKEQAFSWYDSNCDPKLAFTSRG